MSKSLNLGEIHWDDIKHTYYPNGLSEKLQEETILRKMQIQNAAAAIQHSGEQANTPSGAQFNQQLFAQIFPELIRNPESLKRAEACRLWHSIFCYTICNHHCMKAAP